MIGIFIEPETVASARYARMTPVTPISPENRSSPQLGSGQQVSRKGADYWTEIILEILKIENGPMAITALVNTAAKWGDYNCRSDREQRKIQLLKLVGRSIRVGLLARIARNFVVLPATDEKRKAYLKRAAAPVDLPAPRV